MSKSAVIDATLKSREEDFIDLFCDETSPKEELLLGIGDDAAVIATRGPESMVISTDTMVDKVDFNLNYFSPADVAAKLVAINLSDLGAMGATPRYIFLNIVVPRKKAESFIRPFARQIKKICRQERIDLVGGDLSSSPELVMVSATVIGTISPSGSFVRRKGAHPGDKIFVTGNLGDSTAGLDCFKKRNNLKYPGHLAPTINYLKQVHLRPSHRVKSGGFLHKNNLASAMIDISDGLLKDLGRLLKESGCTAQVDVHRIPISKELGEYATFQSMNLLEVMAMVLCGGEDFELCFTVSGNKCDKIESLTKKLNHKITEIGQITEGKPQIILKGLDEENWAKIGDTHLKGYKKKPPGYSHF